jgi:DNA polymerase family A
VEIISLDFETFHGPGYEFKKGSGLIQPDGTKTKATTEAYIRDARFDPVCCCIHFPDGRDWQAGKPDIASMLGAVNWGQTALLCHHAHFDGLILSHHYDIKPAFWLDTLSLANHIVGNHISVSLDSLLRIFNLPAKDVPYNLFRGRHWEELDLYSRSRVLDGCSGDARGTFQVFGKLLERFRERAGYDFPQRELDLIDLTIRWFTEPKIVGDIPLLTEIWHEEKQAKADALAEVGCTATDLRSDEKFAELLEAEDVEIEYKEGKNGPIPCFAATDDFLRELAECDDDRISALASARIEIKSNAVESRAETLGWMASRGALCVYTRYCAAHTTRWGGGDGSNFQNQKRGHRIRSSMQAPTDCYFGAPDASQIECRLLNTVAGQWDVVERFRTGADPYIALASALYGRPITEADVAERGTGKQGELSCGYMAGAKTTQRTAAKGTYGPPAKISLEFAQFIVDTYRATHPAIAGYGGLWQQAGTMLGHIYGRSCIRWGPVEIRGGHMWLPNGLSINYETLEPYMAEGRQEWRLKTRKGWTKMYSGRLVENYIQGLARVKVADDMLEISRELDVVGMSHDEPWVLIPKGPSAEQALQWCIDMLSRPASWLPECPFAAEGKMGERYPKK